MKKLLTLTIGIPAYNEEQNIANLLRHLINQNTNGFNLVKIIVISDGSTDLTVKNAKTIRDNRIKIVSSSSRKGKADRLNQIFRMASSDLLITIDADVSPHDPNFLKKIVNKFSDNPLVSLACVKVCPASDSTNLITRVLSHSQNMKTMMFEKIIDFSPVYLFIGRTFGYSKSLYKRLKFPAGLLAEDAYACLYCLKNNHMVAYQNKSVIYYSPPSNLVDHLKQSARFYNSESQLSSYFGADFIKNSYHIPRDVLLKSFLTGFLNSPILTLLYALILLYSKLIVFFHLIKTSYLWETSVSSKKVAKRI